jgi:hypothetical protein
VRAIFFDEDVASAAVARLVGAGYRAEAHRDRLHGEDDDEDHPWAVLSDAPEFVLDLLCDELEGWLDVEERGPDVPAPPPLVLPDAPKRIKRFPQ